MKEIRENEEGEIKPINEINENPPLLQKYSSDSQFNFDEDDKEKEIEKEVARSYLYNIKDYLLFFSLMISSSMNFNYLYFPLILIGTILNFLIGKNTPIIKKIKFIFELISFIYSILLLTFKIVCLVLIKNDNDIIMEHQNLFFDLGICYLREENTSFYLIMTFLGEAIVILFSLCGFLISILCKNFKRENDISSMKNPFWNNRNLIFLNYFFILSFAVFNVSYSTLFYMCLIQMLFFLSSIKANDEVLGKILKFILFLFKICIFAQIILINVLNVKTLQENVLYDKEIKDKDGNLKIYSIFTQIGINYAYNEQLKFVWKEWIGYLAAILSLISLTYSINNMNAKEAGLLKKKSTISLHNIKNLIKDDKKKGKNPDNDLIEVKKKDPKDISCFKKTFDLIINFLTSSVLIIQFCRVMSIFYIYLYPNFYSIGIFIPLFFSSYFIDIKKNKNLTTYLLAPTVMLTSLFYHVSNINGLFENFSDERRKKFLNFALGKYEYSFLEYYAHNLFFIFVMFLIYSFYNSEEVKEEKKKMKDKKKDNLNEFLTNEEIKVPLLRDTLISENDNNDINNAINNTDEKEEIIEIKEVDEEPINFNEKKSDLNLLNLFLKFVFTYIDKITLIAMYFVAMRSINLIHLVLVAIFLIQILFPLQIQKIYKGIICILQILFLIELVIHLLKAYFIENFNKDFMNFISTYTDIITDNNMELSIFLVLYCFYFQYQFDNFPYLMKIMGNKKINLENYVETRFKKLPKTKYFLNTLGIIISNLYIWILIALFFVVSCYFEINLIFDIKLAYFLLLVFLVFRKIQNPKRGNKFSPLIHYIFLIFCSLNSFLVYLYQFKVDEFIKSNISFSSDNFFTKNLPNIGFSIYLKDNLYLNFLPHFGITFISVLFISEIQRQLKNLKFTKFVKSNTMQNLKEKKNEIDEKLKDETLSDEDIGLLKAQKFEENEIVLKHLAIKYFFVNLMKIFTSFYWLFLFLSIGIIFSFYDLSFSMVIYIIIFSIIFILMFYRRITKLTGYIRKPSYFVSKVIRYNIVEQPLKIHQKLFYRNVAFNFLLAYNFIFFIILYLYGVFDLFQHGCNDSFFKGCEKSNDPIFTPDGTAENYIKAFAYLFGIYVDIRNEGLIKTAWVHILLSVLIGFDIYAHKLENRYTDQSEKIRLNMLKISNENNKLFRHDRMKDTNILIKIGLKLAGINSSKEVLEKMNQENSDKNKEKEEEQKKKEEDKIEEKEDKTQDKKDIIEIKTDTGENNINEQKIIDEKQRIEEEEKKRIAAEQKALEDEKINNADIDENNASNYFLKDEIVKKFRKIFVDSYDNDQTLSDSNNNVTKLIWFLKKIFEELIIVLLICIALTKLNLLSFYYFLYFAYLTNAKRTMRQFYILYCILLLLIILQSIVYITNISEDTCPRPKSDLLKILTTQLSIPWYRDRLNIDKKYAFFFGFGVNKTQMGLLLLEYILVIALYIYLDVFSFSIYQDVINRGEKRTATSKFNFGAVKLNEMMKREIKSMSQKTFTQYKECLLNFNLDIGNNTDELNQIFSIKDEQRFQSPNFKPDAKEYEKLILRKNRYYQFREKMKREGRDNVPDSEFIRAFQEFSYLYLHIFILLAIIIISVVIPGLISIFYLSICFYYLINSQKIFLGLKYGYPKQIKRLIKFALIIDIVIQLIYQIPYISSDKDSLLYKIFNALGFTKLLDYSNNSDVELVSAGIIEIIGKPLIYLFISLQTIIYNSKDFKKYYILFLLSLKMEMNRNGFVNAFIFNNLRIGEFQNSVDMRIQSYQKMEEIKKLISDWTDKFKIEGIGLFEEPKKDPLKVFHEKDKKEKEEKKKEEIKIEEEKKKEIVIEEKKEDNIENKIEENKEEGISPGGLFSKLNKKMKEKKKEETEKKEEEIKPAPSMGLFGNLKAKMDAKKAEEKKEVKGNNEDQFLNNIKEKGIFGLFGEVEKIKRETVDAEKIKEKIKSILLSGKLTRFYLWFNRKSTYFKSMEWDNKLNFEKECFIGNTITKSYLENEIDQKLKILDLSDFDEKEVELIEEFFTKFKNGKLMKELEKIKSEIKKAKINRFKESRQNQEINIINTNINNDNIIINNNNEDEIDEKELENIEVEYNFKKGKRDININALKFRQFYYLLDTKLFKIYLQKSYLIKSILSNLESFFANNFDYFTYLIMIINHMNNCSLLSMFYPLSVFCYALLENPRPKKTYWQICIYYSIIVLILKFIFQLKLFTSLIEPESYSEFVNNLHNYKIGIRYFNEGFSSNFFGYIALDSLLLLVLSLNKNILIGNGLWDKREEQLENIFLGSERHQIFKDRDVEKVFPSLLSYKRNKLLSPPEEEEKPKDLKKSKKRIKKGKIDEDKNEEKINKSVNKLNELLEEKKIDKSDEKDKKSPEKGKAQTQFAPEDIILYYEGMKDIPKYDEGNKKYFEKLFPRIRNEKPGVDKYPFSALSLAVVIIYILLFFTQMSQDKTYGPVNLDTTQFSGSMVLFLIFHVIILVYDRVLYISQNRTNLKYKYFLYKKDKINKGIPISKQEYFSKKEGYWEDRSKPFHFSPYLIQKYKNENYNIFYIQTEDFNKPLFQKYILHLLTTLICHGFAFYYFPMVGNYNLGNNVYCIEDDPKLCNDFTNNIYIIIFYIFYLIYLYISCAQIRLGYHDIKRKSLFKRNTGVTNLITKVFNAIPFLPQIRNVIDWTFTSTCFDLFQWIKFESIYDSIFDAYTDSNPEDDDPIGERVARKKKIGMGGILSFILIFLLIIPLVLFSSLNPTNKLNNLNAGKLNVDLTFIYESGVELNYNLFENTRAKTISDMFKNSNDDTDWKRYKYDQSVQTRNFNHEQIQIIKFSETSDRNWDLAEPHINDLIDLLNITKNEGLDSIILKIHTEFERSLPAETQTVSHDFEVPIFDTSMNITSSEGAIKILDLKTALENCSNVEIELKEGYSSPLRITAGEEITEIEDEKYIPKKTIQLGFKGCEKEQKIMDNETVLINTYLKSYFTFKSKDPEEALFTGVEFHAFNDKISETTSGYSVLTFYLTFILVAGSYVADFLASEPEKIMFTDLPHPEELVNLCEGIQIARYSYDFKGEETLYTILIEFMRSPEYLKMLTQSSMENLKKRGQNTSQENEENEEEKDDEDKGKDNDDEDDLLYKDEEEINRRISAEIERRKKRFGNGPPGGVNKKRGEDNKNGNNIDNIKEEKIEKQEKPQDK